MFYKTFNFRTEYSFIYEIGYQRTNCCTVIVVRLSVNRIIRDSRRVLCGTCDSQIDKSTFKPVENSKRNVKYI